MALKKVKGNLERLFDKNLSDLVRGIRNNKDNEGKYIAQCMEEIKVELRQDNIGMKANAVTKLTYLQMLGYDISWAGFNVIEVMSSAKFTHKRMGYLSASQCFHTDSELLMLTTNMIRKDLSSQNQYEAGVALSALSCFVSPDLARDLANDVMTLLTSTKPYLRKKGVLMLYKIFLKYPDALRPAFPRLKEKLEDPDPGVQSAAVNVVCELARKNPKNYLSLAPIFFKLMTTSTNNWMLIKIIKLFGALTPLEPRLGKKLIEPLTNLIHSTSAMSLLYECINTTIAGMPNHNASIQLCVQKLRILIEDSDQNLKYLGLLAMSRILATHPKSVQMHMDLVMRCLDDKDESIRLRALDLLYGMVNKKNLMEIVKKLMVHMEKAEGTTYRDELLAKIIQICSQNNYQHITNFEWYVSVLVELTRVEGVSHGDLVTEQLLDVAVRVHAIRPFCAQQMSILIENPFVIFGLSGGSSRASSMTKVLYAAAWICGEYVQFLPHPKTTLLAMLEPKISQLPFQIQAVFLQNCLKILSSILSTRKEGEEEEVLDLAELQEKTQYFVSSSDLEVQERAGTLFNIIKAFLKLQVKGEMDLPSLGEELKQFFVTELNPVAAKAQKKVPIPEGLDLDAWINDPPSESEEEEVQSEVFVQSVAEFYGETKEKRVVPQLTEEEIQRLRETRKLEQELNPHYLKPTAKSGLLGASSGQLAEVPPVASLELNVPLSVPGLVNSDKYLKVPSKKNKKTKKKKRDKGKDKDKVSEDEDADAEDSSAPTHIVSTSTDMPEGATISDNEDSHLPENDPHRALNIDLDIPLESSESIPNRSHRVASKKDPHYLTNESTTHHHHHHHRHNGEEVKESSSKSKKKSSKDKEGKKKKHKKEKHKDKKVKDAPEEDKEMNLLLHSFVPEEDNDMNLLLDSFEEISSNVPTVTSTEEQNGGGDNHVDEFETAGEVGLLVDEELAVEKVPEKEKSSKKSKKDKKVKKDKKEKQSKKVVAAVVDMGEEPNLF